MEWQKVLEYLLSWSDQQQYLFLLGPDFSVFLMLKESLNSKLAFEWEPW